MRESMAPFDFALLGIAITPAKKLAASVAVVVGAVVVAVAIV